MLLTIEQVFNDFLNKPGVCVVRCGRWEIENLLKNEGIDFNLKNNTGFCGDNKDYLEWKNDYNRALMNADYHQHVLTCPSFSCVGDYLVKLNLYIPTIPYIENIEFWLSVFMNIKNSNKKLGIVSFFADEMKEQYKKLSTLFPSKYDFSGIDIEFIKTENTCGSETKSYSKTLKKIKNKINNSNCDIYILSCGLYGLPLCDFIKTKNKSSLYIGGLLQMLFGLKGKRWDNRSDMNKFYNKNWKEPESKPNNWNKIENGCYW